MARKEKKYHFIYKTTNVLSGKYYLGMHSTDDLNDGYMGSGKRLRYSINKYGKENHKVEIVEFVETRAELKVREAEIVNLNEIAKEECINLCVGGTGGFISLTGAIKGGKVSGDIIKKRIESDEDFKLKYQLNLISIVNKACEEGKYSKNKFRKEKHSEETKQKMRKSKNVGSSNSQFGTCWITKEGTNKKIKKEDLETYLNEGWVKGRR